MDLDKLSTYTSRIYLALSKIDQGDLDKVISIFNECADSRGTIWIAGNGGSAATASHFATDLSRCKNSRNETIRGISLCDNSGLLTAISNDFEFKYTFSHQLSNLANTGDLLLVISASGNSDNILEALTWAKRNRVKSISLTGFDGGKANKISDVSINVPTDYGDYGVAEDSHSIICHYFASKLRR